MLDNVKKIFLKYKKVNKIFFFSLVLIIVMVVVFFSLNNSKNIDKIFNKNNYKVFYSFGQNMYDYKNLCFNSNLENSECIRETEFNDEILLKIVNFNSRNNTLEATISFDNNYDILDIELNYVYKENDNDINSPTFSYIENMLKTEDYSHYYDKDINCYNIKTSNKINYNNIKYCETSIINKLSQNKDNALKILKKVKLDSDDIYKYISNYFNKYIKINYQNLKHDFDYSTISNSEIEKALDREFFSVSKINNSVFFYILLIL